MNKCTYILAIAVICSCSDGNNSYKVTGNTTVFEGKIYLTNSEGPIDSTTVTDGSFTFSGTVDNPDRAFIMDAPTRLNATARLPFYLEPGNISIKEIDDDIYITGTPANDAQNRFYDESAAIEEAYGNPAFTDEQRDSVYDSYIDLEKKTLAENKSNIFGLYMLQNLSYEDLFSPQEIMETLEAFPEGIRETAGWKQLKETTQLSLKTTPGNPYMDFTQNNPEGEPVSLSSVIKRTGNKYVLLDFWASWCGPCMAEVPYLVETYNEYHKKGFEIFGTSLDRDSESWTSCIKENSMAWVHVSDIKYWDNAAAELYGIRSIPQNLLIDCSTGLIVAKNLRGEAVREKLKELLGE